MTEIDKSKMDEISTSKGSMKVFPVLDNAIPGNSDEFKLYKKNLQRFFLTGKKSKSTKINNGTPALLDHFLKDDSLNISYPLVWDHASSELKEFQNILRDLIIEYFGEDEANLLSKKLSSVIAEAQDKAAIDGKRIDYEYLIQETVDTFKNVEGAFQDIDAFQDRCQKVLNQLLDKKVTTLDLSSSTPFTILNLQLGRRRVRNQAFHLMIKKSLSEVNEILLLNGSQPDSLKSSFDFADDLISMDQIKDMTPSLEISALSEERLSRLRVCHQVLSNAQINYSDNAGVVFVSDKLNEEFGLDQIFTDADVKTCSDLPCSKANAFYKKEIDNFVSIIRALRIVDLEVHQQYEEGLHDSYFDGFSRSYLSDEDLIYFSPVLLIEDSKGLMSQTKDLLALLSNDSLVKIFSVTRLNDIQDLNDDADRDSFLDMATLVIFRRNVNFFQSGLDTPFALNDAIDDEIDTPFPTFWNILLPSKESVDIKYNILLIKAAIESRCFPRIKYEVKSGSHIGDRLDISKNAQNELEFPSYAMGVQSAEGDQTLNFSLTPCDFYLMNSENLASIEVLPSIIKDDSLASMQDYLLGKSNSTKGRIPVLWMVEDDNKLKQVVVPVSWVQRARSRMDFWSFMNDLSGGFSDKNAVNLQELKSELKAEKDKEISSLKEEMESEFKAKRSGDLERSITRILYRLVDTDKDVSQILESMSTTVVTPEVKSPSLQAADPEIKESKQKKQEKEEKVVQAEAWVESDECTSCNDCIDALPGVFKYNEDKQAVVHNPNGGTYAKIVAAAEKCPAACIHPGLPKDKNEPNIDKLLKRAEKFN